ncbi:MAG: riboflavin synthase [Candidatus Acidulodesulfobacterium sp.]
MFTGIIKETGKVKSISAGVISIAVKDAGKSSYIGQSISVNGVCLTVKKIAYPVLSFDYTPATFNASALKYLKINEAVNIEPALSVNSDISGHFVLGHVDGIGKIIETRKFGNSIIIGIKITHSIDGNLEKYIIAKGSVSIDGISLTVNGVKNGLFFVSIIPLTYRETNLNYKTIGDYVNIESDIIERTVVSRLKDLGASRLICCNEGNAAKEENGYSKAGGVTVEFLTENGFI